MKFTVFMLILCIVILGIFGYSKLKDSDSNVMKSLKFMTSSGNSETELKQSFELIVSKLSESYSDKNMINRWIDNGERWLELEGVRYNINKTDSLISPYIGSIKWTVSEYRKDLKTSEISRREFYYRVDLPYQNQIWVLNDGYDYDFDPFPETQHESLKKDRIEYTKITYEPDVQKIRYRLGIKK